MLSAWVAAFALWGVGSAAAATVPGGFEDTQVTSTALDPTSLAFAPDGSLLITTKPGLLQVYKAGALVTALNLSAVVCANSERGMVGVAVDPDFLANRRIYLYYTFNKHGVCDVNTPTTPVNRLSRFVLPTNNVVDPASEVVLIDNIPSKDGIHNGGDLHFGKDGNLYVSVGDSGCDPRGDSGCSLLNDASRDLGGLSGKILRVTAAGGIPAGNPFTGADSDRCNVTGGTSVTRKCQEIYASGLRNPFRLAFDPNAAGTLFHINDVGTRTWEEIDVGAAGADYGWNVREGPCAQDSTTDCGPPPVGMTNPIYAYDHSGPCTAITAGAFVPRGSWPGEYDGRYLFSDHVCGKIFRLDPAGGGGFTASEFATDIVLPITAIFGPHGSSQALYYITWQKNRQEVRRIAYIGSANRQPIARLDADRTSGDLPLAVEFDGSLSSDADGDPLAYDWSFGDGSSHPSTPAANHTYTTAGAYTATLRVTDGRGGEDTASVPIFAGSNPPVVAIDSPVAGQRFSVGENITLHGAATDPQDGPLPPSALTWEVIKHHGTHTHPFLPQTSGNDVPLTAPPPEDLSATTSSYLEILLTATNSRGHSATVSQELRPKLVDLSFNTSPSGLKLRFSGIQLTMPQTITSWHNWDLPVSAPDQNDSAGNPFDFLSWSDGGAASHAITTPSSPAAYAATFIPAYARPQSASRLRFSLVPAFRQTISATQCAARGGTSSQHGPPLAFDSCNRPTYLPGTLARIGAQGAASASYQVVAGDEGTPADEADVQISLAATDIRNRQAGGDYLPSPTAQDIAVISRVRVTDRHNGPGLTLPATLVDHRLALPVDCAATSALNTGAVCSLTSTAEAVVPDMVRERARMVIQVHRVALADSGQNGILGDADDRPFTQQGLFIP